MKHFKEAYFNQKLHERVLFLMYQKEFRDLSFQSLNNFFDEDFSANTELNFGEVPVFLAQKVFLLKTELDTIIKKHSKNWKIERVMLIDKIILRIGIYELLHEPSMKTGIVIDRAIRLAKMYGGESSGKFVNGILGSVYRKYRAEENNSAAEETEITKGKTNE